MEGPRNPRKALSLEILTQWLAEKCGLPYMHIDPFKIDFAAVTKVMSSAYAERFKILPVGVTSKEATIATAEPFVRGWEESLKQVLRLDIKRVIANPVDIQGYIVEFFNLARSVKGATEKDKGAYSAIANFEQLVQLGRSGKLDANDQHIVHICDWLFNFAFEQRASDIHLEPRREVSNVRFQIDGVLHHVYQIPTPVPRRDDQPHQGAGPHGRGGEAPAAGRAPENRDARRRRGRAAPVDHADRVRREAGHADLQPGEPGQGLQGPGVQRGRRAQVDAHGGRAARHRAGHRPDRFRQDHHLYSTLKQLALPEVNVCSVEDPIEMVEPAFNQMQVQQALGVDFASGIRTLMRQDPDIIMVGEIRDLETAEMAVQAALTGHLVLSTLHTNDAPSAITRLLDLGVPSYLMQSCILGVMAQRLVRALPPLQGAAGPG